MVCRVELPENSNVQDSICHRCMPLRVLHRGFRILDDVEGLFLSHPQERLQFGLE